MILSESTGDLQGVNQNITMKYHIFGSYGKAYHSEGTY